MLNEALYYYENNYGHIYMLCADLLSFDTYNFMENNLILTEISINKEDVAKLKDYLNANCGGTTEEQIHKMFVIETHLQCWFKIDKFKMVCKKNRNLSYI